MNVNTNPASNKSAVPTCLRYERVHGQHTIVGLADVHFPALHMVVRYLGLHLDPDGRRRVTMPARPLISNGELQRGPSGFLRWGPPVLSFGTAELQSAFCRAVIAAVLEKHPTAFDRPDPEAGEP